MSTGKVPGSDRRIRKRLATRRAISDAATRLFFERGFDQVSIDEIAETADVSRMTVFNHFPRKEDMLFDQEEVIEAMLLDAVRSRAPGATAIVALQRLAHTMVEEGNPLIPLSEGPYRFVEAVMASEALRARARQMRDDMVASLASVMAETTDQVPGSSNAHLAAGLMAATWSVAFLQARQIFAVSRDEISAKQLFLTLIDRGAAGANAALAGTPYAVP